MKLVVLGATGGTGVEIIRQALKRGHDVTAFVRSSKGLQGFKDRITVKQGDLLNGVELERVIRGNDAVISAFGPRLPISKANKAILQQFANVLTAAMPPAGVKRLVAVSTAFLFRDSLIPPTYLIGRLFFPEVVDDASVMENIIKHSLTDWTIVRPPRLTDKPFSGKYRVMEGKLPPYGFSVSRADVADCLVKVIDNPVRVDKVLGISN